MTKHEGRRRLDEAKRLFVPFVTGFFCIEVGYALLEDGDSRTSLIGAGLLANAVYMTYILARMPLED